MSETHGDVNHRPGAVLSAGSQTVLPTVRFSPVTTVSFAAAANTIGTLVVNAVLENAKQARIDTKYERVLNDPAKRDQPPRLIPVSAHITRDGRVWTLVSESTTAWQNCVASLLGSQF